ncbi:hypothetical protein PO909_026077 [Leuciscus waleckii]
MQSQFCVPVRLNHVKNSLVGAEDNTLEQKVVYKISAFEQDFVLELQSDSSFIAPGFSTRADPTAQNSAHSEDLSRCFYAGEVNSDPYSYAALSLCKGLQGAFGYDGCGVDSDVTHTVEQYLAKFKHMKEHMSNITMSVLKNRSKRFVSIPRYVETLVVADESMAKFHGDDLKHYVLTLMSVAAKLYKHPTILNSINIVVVKFMVINEEEKGPKVSGNAAMTLRNFCTWQKKLNKNNDKHEEYWDTAILFTKQVRGNARFVNRGQYENQ